LPFGNSFGAIFRSKLLAVQSLLYG